MTEKHTQNVNPFHDVPPKPDAEIAWGAMRSGLEGDPNKPDSAASEEQKTVYRHLSPENIGPGHPDDWRLGPDTVSTLPGKVPQEPGRQAEIDSLEFWYAEPARKPEDRNPNRTDNHTSPEASGISGVDRKTGLGRSAVEGQTTSGRHRQQRGRRRAN